MRDASQQGKKKGDIFTWDVFSDVATAGGVLTETNTMPESNFSIVQGTLTMTEAGKLIARFFNGLRAVVMGSNVALVA